MIDVDYSCGIAALLLVRLIYPTVKDIVLH